MTDSELASDSPLSDRLVDEIQRRIFAGEIGVGTWLRHNTLAAEFGTSRTPVREALHVLHAQGIVTIVRNRGARVNGHSGREVRDNGQVRAELEGLAAELAAAWMDDGQQERMTLAVADFRAAIADYKEDPARMFTPEAAQRWRNANEDFHSSIVEGSGNPQIAASIADLSRRMPRNMSYSAYAGSTRALIRNLEEHDLVAQAILAGDAGTARRAMKDHVLAATEASARWLEGGRAGSLD